LGFIFVFLQKIFQMNIELHLYPIYGLCLGIDYFNNDHDADRDTQIDTICLQIFVVGININLYRD